MKTFAAPRLNIQGIRPRIEDAIRRWDEARRSDASAARLLDDRKMRRRLTDDRDQNLVDWYEGVFRELAEATDDLVTLLREAGLRAYVHDGTLYADASQDIDPIDQEDDGWRIAAIPLGAVAGL